MVVGAVIISTFLYLCSGLEAMNMLFFYSRYTLNGNDTQKLTFFLYCTKFSTFFKMVYENIHNISNNKEVIPCL